MIRVAGEYRETSIVQVRIDQGQRDGSRGRSFVRGEEYLVPIDAKVGNNSHAVIGGKEFPRQVHAHGSIGAAGQPHVLDNRHPLPAAVANLEVRRNHLQLPI